ncbi:unnamed protein product [Peniophora sp. CBMAI 1063]|nr:unnamed protein product [Peniophora sp. CBMAI 1063]
MPTPYELDREKRIAANKALLAGLHIQEAKRQVFGDQPKPAKSAPAPKKSKVRKRKTPPPSDSADTDGEEAKPVVKAVRVDESGLRRSSRNAGKSVDYTKEKVGDPVQTVVRHKGEGIDREPSKMSKRVHNPKTFGSIPGVQVGDWWQTREDCSVAAIHAPWVAGIAGGPKGAYSLALSGGYEDDVDLGEGFTYTGAGGRDLKGTKKNPKNLRTAPQSCDQTFENNNNKSLRISSETKKPVRVIRGYKLHSEYAPVEGYRYDGLYTVEKAWQEPGMNPGGYLVCKFALKRIPGQPPLPTRPLALDEAGEDGAEDEDESEAGAEADEDVKEEVAASDAEAVGNVDGETEANDAKPAQDEEAVGTAPKDEVEEA